MIKKPFDNITDQQKRYDKWAPDYNKDVENMDYSGPEYIVTFLSELASAGKVAPHDPNLKILDVGCGTGLAGTALGKRGYQHIDGIDFSQGMIAEAHKTGWYKNLIGWCDLRETLPFFLHNQYDLVVCCGVFARDFVLPESLLWLVQAAKPGGIVMLTTKKSYYDTYDFEGFYKRLEQSGQISFVACRENAPYLKEENAHYWAFSVTKIKNK